jgi:pilus assembly protein CpaC
MDVMRGAGMRQLNLFKVRLKTAGALLALLAVTAADNRPLLFAQQQVARTQSSNSNEPLVPITAHRTDLEVIERFAKVLETKNRIVRVDGFDPAILNVSALTPNRIRISGLMQGVTTLVIYDEMGANLSVEIFVKGDSRTLQAIIDRKFPNSSIEAFKVQDAIALRGWVSHPEHITQIVEIAEQYYPKVLNQMKVGGVQQVLLKVKVMEAQRSTIRELGMNFTYLNRNGFVNSSPGSITSLDSVSLPFKPGVPSATALQSSIKNATGSFGIIGDNNIFSSYITALRTENLLKILAEPEVLALNGRPATLLSGGEFPILVPQSLGTVSIQYRPFGVQLEAVPVVLGGGSLRLELQPEVSDRDFSNAVTINGITVPALTVRRVNTQVEMKFGQTLMLAGLISSKQATTIQKVPFLGELPYIGMAFSRKKSEDSETEVVITVTPELVAPLDEGQVPSGGPGRFTDAPTDRELMVYGLVEVPKTGERCETCGPEQSAPYIVPGLKKSGSSATSSPVVPPPVPSSDLPLPPPPTSESDQSVRSKRVSAPMIARRSGSSSSVKQAGFDDLPQKSASTEPEVRRSQSSTKTSPRRSSLSSNQSPNNSDQSMTGSGQISNSTPNSRSSEQSNAGSAPKSGNGSNAKTRKPGLIEPAAR